MFGKDEVKSEEEFRNKIAESLKPQLETNSNFKFLLDVREYCEKKRRRAHMAGRTPQARYAPEQPGQGRGVRREELR